MTVLPPEILDHIFGLLAHTDYDDNSLRACAEAHPFLSDAAERHLFSDIKVQYGSTYGRAFNASELSKLFHDKPRLANYVESLAIELWSCPVNEEPNLGPIPFIVTMVSRLRKIDLKVMGSNRIEWPRFPGHFRDALTNCLGLPSMKCVSLSGVDKFPIIALDQCTTLSLDRKVDFSNSSSKSYPHLESLSIYKWSGMFPDVIAWAKKIKLRHLDICFPGVDECAMLFQVCPTIATLDLDLLDKCEFSCRIFVIIRS